MNTAQCAGYKDKEGRLAGDALCGNVEKARKVRVGQANRKVYERFGKG